jgi:hypothetical protein
MSRQFYFGGWWSGEGRFREGQLGGQLGCGFLLERPRVIIPEVNDVIESMKNPTLEML